MSTLFLSKVAKLENYSFTYDENKKSIVSSNMTLPLIHHVSYTILLLITAGAQNHPSEISSDIIQIWAVRFTQASSLLLSFLAGYDGCFHSDLTLILLLYLLGFVAVVAIVVLIVFTFFLISKDRYCL